MSANHGDILGLVMKLIRDECQESVFFCFLKEIDEPVFQCS